MQSDRRTAIPLSTMHETGHNNKLSAAASETDVAMATDVNAPSPGVGI